MKQRDDERRPFTATKIDRLDARVVGAPGDLITLESFRLVDVDAVSVLRVAPFNTPVTQLDARITLTQNELIVLDIPAVLADAALAAPLIITAAKPLTVLPSSCAVAFYGVARRPRW